MNLKEGKAAQKLAGSSASVTREGVLIFRQSGAQQGTAPAYSPQRARPAVAVPSGADEIVGVLAAMALACLAGR